jgi:hypothetical protein
MLPLEWFCAMLATPDAIKATGGTVALDLVTRIRVGKPRGQWDQRTRRIMRRIYPVVKRLSFKTARVAEREGFASMSGCINWLTLAIILVAAFGILGIGLLAGRIVLSSLATLSGKRSGPRSSLRVFDFMLD